MRSTRTPIAARHLGTVAAVFMVLAVAGCGAQSAQPGAAPATSHPTTSRPTSHPTRHPTTSHPATAGTTSPTTTTGTTSTTSTASASGGGSATPAGTPAATSPPATAQPTSSATPSPTITAKKVHFATPEAAMRYLTTAWNDYNMTDLKHVTQGTARTLLLGMYQQAVNLRLDYCALRPGGNGDYLCHFTHDYPASYPVRLRQGKHGTAEFIAAPSASVGWYMFAYEGCG